MKLPALNPPLGKSVLSRDLFILFVGLSTTKDVAYRRTTQAFFFLVKVLFAVILAVKIVPFCESIMWKRSIF